MSLPEKSDLELTVEFETTSDFKIQWLKNNQSIASNECYSILIQKGKSTLNIINLDKSKSGKYEVIIECEKKVVKSSCAIKLVKIKDEEIIEAPIFTKTLKPTSVKKNDIFIVDTIVESYPLASFQWFIGSKEVNALSKENKLDNIYVTTHNNVSSLCIENINSDFEGIITCRAENFGGSVSCSASLQVSDTRIPDEHVEAPAFIQPLISTTIMDGEPIILKCITSGWPRPKILWEHNKIQLKKARDIHFGRQSSGLCELFIKEAFPEMSGTYKCIAINEFGSCSSECTVTIEGSVTTLCMINSTNCMTKPI